MALKENWWGLIPFIIGVLMAFGFKILRDSPPQAGLLSVLGQKTNVRVDGWTLLFKPFGIKVIDIVLFDTVKVDFTIPIENITCVDLGIVDGIVSLSISPGKTGNELRKYDNVGQLEGVKLQLNDILEVAVQQIAEMEGHTTHYMTTKGVEIGLKLKERVEAKNANDHDESDDKRGLGIEIHKLQIKLKKNPAIVAAEQQTLVTDVMNARITKRLAYYRKENANPMPSAQEVRRELLEEDRNGQGLIKEVRGGAVNVNQT